MYRRKHRVATLILIAAIAAHAESLWTVNTAKVKPGMIEKARRYYDLAWLPARQEALRRGYIKSFRLLAASEESKTGTEFVLITEYPSPEQFADREKHFQLLFDELKTPRPILVDGLRRDEIFESVKGLENYREVAPAPAQKP